MGFWVGCGKTEGLCPQEGGDNKRWMSGVGNEDSVAEQEAWEGSQEETSDPETEGWENSFKCTSVMCS